MRPLSENKAIECGDCDFIAISAGEIIEHYRVTGHKAAGWIKSTFRLLKQDIASFFASGNIPDE